jgi:hypothetical protein
MSLTFIATLVALALLFGTLVFLELGWRIGRAKARQEPDGLTKGAGSVEAAVFGLMGLLIAFTFSGATSKFEARRHLITEEANAIGTAYLRIDVMPAQFQPEMRALFQRYLDGRILAFKNMADVAGTKTKFAESEALQQQIWTKAIAACHRPDTPSYCAMLLLPALNQMIDITTTRLVATKNHPPTIIYILLIMLSCIGALLAGYGMSTNKDRSLLHIFAFAVMMSLTVYVIIDIEFPRLGLIRVDAADQVLMELRQGMR